MIGKMKKMMGEILMKMRINLCRGGTYDYSHVRFSSHKVFCSSDDFHCIDSLMNRIFLYHTGVKYMAIQYHYYSGVTDMATM